MARGLIELDGLGEAVAEFRGVLEFELLVEIEFEFLGVLDWLAETVSDFEIGGVLVCNSLREFVAEAVWPVLAEAVYES